MKKSPAIMTGAEARAGTIHLPASALRASKWTMDITSAGNSMEPLICEGDTISVACGETTDVCPGDVVCFQRGDQYVVHRIVEADKINPDMFREKGDAESGGCWIHRDAMIGKVLRVNGTALDENYGKSVMRIGAVDHTFSRLRKKISKAPLPPFLQKVWRTAKVSWLRRIASNHE